jgi:pimeloyl-ACP methyl ester carboxylesterase
VSNPGPPYATFETRLTWGPVLRGVRWGAGPHRVILLHEPGTDLDAWDTLPRDLAGALPVEVLVYDLPGHGLSDDPWHPERLPDAIREVCSFNLPVPGTVLVAAGDTATASLRVAAAIPLAGVICLSPTPEAEPLLRSQAIPKHCFAGSQAESDLATARRLAAQAGGWSVVTAVPVAARGTELLRSDWGQRVADATTVFIRDCLHLTPPRRLPHARRAG